MKDLPYYRLWVKDFDTNENVRLLNLPEAGLYLFSLNHAWVNDGLPESPEDIARALKISSKDFAKFWPRVSRCFSADGAGRLRNKRQEEERIEAVKASERARANVQKRYEKSTTVEKSYGSGSTRAVDSVSDSDASSLNLVFLEKKSEEKPFATNFELWWSRWCELTGRVQRKSFACQAWLSVVTVELAPAAFTCLERYGLSDEARRGIVKNPDNWIYEQARDNFTGEWQERKTVQSSGLVSDMERYLNEH